MDLLMYPREHSMKIAKPETEKRRNTQILKYNKGFAVRSACEN